MTERYLSRREAAQHLTERGLKLSPNTLMKMATTGGGPRYCRWGTVPFISRPILMRGSQLS